MTDRDGRGSTARLATRWRCGVIIASLLLAGVTVPATAAEDSVQLTEEQRALGRAQASGEPVELTGQRTETRTIYANPDGVSFRLEQSAVPVRVRDSRGAWTAPDATLVRRADGTLAAKAAVVGVVFSGGGDGAGLVMVERSGRSLALGWPGSLPVPEVDGAVAVYREVLPGVDLRMTATVEGFRQHLVIKTPEAAARADVKRITYGLKAHGVALQQNSSGGFVAVDGDGAPIFKVPPAQMWDSAGRGTAPASAAGSAAKGSGESPENSVGEPDAGDNVADMATDVSATALTVVPDAQMLTETPASAFPLVVDPTITWTLLAN